MKPTIAVHGGAGTILRSQMTGEREAAYRRGLTDALLRGQTILRGGGPALDAVEAAVQVLEDNPLFNAGKGSVFTHQGTNEMDASIMCGQTLSAGAVAGVCSVRNPIHLARRVMENTDHVLLSGAGALDLAGHLGLPLEPPAYFFNEDRFRQLQAARHADEVRLDHSHGKTGTVGAVACDARGNLAAATSSGGMTNKKWGRIGDSAVIGAGTYADNRTCAVSCTGYGEFFIRGAAAYDLSCRMAYQNMDLHSAAQAVIFRHLPGIGSGGEGGLIAVDGNGECCLVFNSPGMYRAWFSPGGDVQTAIYREA